ncbi:MAG: HD domain-containing protein, partial [Actinobacteria bacterium]|nr:HD domain-containing protein [Actinomycetota bacterium]
MRRIEIEEARPGMTVARAILTEYGDVLLHRGVELTDRYILSLRDRGYSSILVEDLATAGINVPETISGEVRASISGKLNETFGAFRTVTKDLNGQPLDKVAAGLQSDAYRQSADKIDPYRTMIDDIRRMVDDLLTVDVLDGLNAIKLHGDWLLQHSIDVTVVALMIGKQLRLDPRDLRMLALGSLVHDVGKTFIDKAIVTKPCPLSRGEWDKMREHPRLGYLLLRSSGSPQDLLAHHVAYQHHERQDGTGYPRGLRGTNRVMRVRRGRSGLSGILPIAEIVAVANVYEALSTRRAYRTAYAHEHIPGMLQQLAGTVLNSELVSALDAVLPLIPTGTSIDVVGGEYDGFRGVVARIDRQHLRRPWIRLLSDPAGRETTL